CGKSLGTSTSYISRQSAPDTTRSPPTKPAPRASPSVEPHSIVYHAPSIPRALHPRSECVRVGDRLPPPTKRYTPHSGHRDPLHLTPQGLRHISPGNTHHLPPPPKPYAHRAVEDAATLRGTSHPTLPTANCVGHRSRPNDTACTTQRATGSPPPDAAGTAPHLPGRQTPPPASAEAVRAPRCGRRSDAARYVAPH
ncbi:hypothetical protein B0H19DRAFT_1341630, partial [Mycena capillaripes]